MGDSKSSPPSSPEYFDFPDKDDSPPHRRDKLRALWQEQDDMMRDLVDGSMEMKQNYDAFPNDQDSPRTRTGKLQQLWQEQDDMMRDLVDGSMEVNENYDAFPNDQKLCWQNQPAAQWTSLSLWERTE